MLLQVVCDRKSLAGVILTAAKKDSGAHAKINEFTLSNSASGRCATAADLDADTA